MHEQSPNAMVVNKRMGPRQREIPSADVALRGIPIVLKSSKAHPDCAAILAEHGHFGAARSHLILAIEESEKARTLGQIVLKDPLPEGTVRLRLYSHSERHIGALRKSWSQGATVDYAVDSLRERLRLKPAQSDEQRWQLAIARHPEALPEDWPARANQLREAACTLILVPTACGTALPMSTQRSMWSSCQRLSTCCST